MNPYIERLNCLTGLKRRTGQSFAIRRRQSQFFAVFRKDSETFALVRSPSQTIAIRRKVSHSSTDHSILNEVKVLWRDRPF